MPRGGGRGGGRGAGRGSKRTHKGGRRHFTDVDEINKQLEKKERQDAWNKQRGLEGGDDENENEGEGEGKERQGAAARDLPPSESESESETESEDEEKPKGVSHLIEIENPNRAGGRQIKKVTELDSSKATQLSRKEREEVEKQQARAHYQKLHLEGKTEEAKADLARLAIIKKQREEQKEKREKEDAAKKKS